MYSVEEVNHILYHNRSSKLIEKFLPKLDPMKVVVYENKLKFCKELFGNIEGTEFSVDEFNMESSDILFTKTDIKSLSKTILKKSKDTLEYQYLIDRGLSDDIIEKYHLTSMSLIKDKRDLDILGCTTHPLLEKILGDGVNGGGILFPLFNKGGDLINVAIRRISSDNKMKYNLAIPDIDLWGLDNIDWEKPVWITEGLFDRISMIENGIDNVVSASTPGLSIIHLMRILENKPVGIKIWSDKDGTGIKHSGIIQKWFRICGILCEVYVSEESKDPFDHFFVDKLSVDDIYPVKITKDLINSFPQNINENFLEYLKNRNF